ncbi:MAG: hypothetical protein IPJ34_20740 [Myxococcales bacterium]|nr:hypothetical protein [Myxococcales bacterium]
MRLVERVPENGVGDTDMRARELALVEVLLFAKVKAAAFDIDERELGLAYDPLSEELFDIPVSRDL